MSPSIDSGATLAVPSTAGATPGKTIRRQPSASRITVSTRPTVDEVTTAGLPASHPKPRSNSDATASGSPVITASKPRASGTRTKKVASRRRGRGRGAETESETEEQGDGVDEENSSVVNSAASSSSVSEASASDLDSSEDETDDEDDEQEPAREADDPATSLEAVEYQQWSTMTEEELGSASSHRRVVQPAAPASADGAQEGHLALHESRGSGRGARFGRGRGRGNSVAGAAIAYREKLQKDPSFTPRVGQFWGHDERLLDQDLRGLSGWWRGRGRGVAEPEPRGRGKLRGRTGAAMPVATFQDDAAAVRAPAGPRGGVGRGRGRGSFRGAHQPRFGNPAYEPSSNPPPRKSKLAGWDDDESEVDDDALHGKSVKRVPSAAQPIYPHRARPAPTKQGLEGGSAKPQVDGRAETAEDKEGLNNTGSAVPAHQGWESGAATPGGQIRAWKDALDEEQVSPSEPPAGSPGVDAHSSTPAVAACVAGSTSSSAKEVAVVGASARPPVATAKTSKDPSVSAGGQAGANDGKWTHDGFEALQKADSMPRAQAVRGGAARGGSVRGVACLRGAGRGRGAAFNAFRGRGGFVPPFATAGRGAAIARGSGLRGTSVNGRGQFAQPSGGTASSDPPKIANAANGDALVPLVQDLDLTQNNKAASGQTSVAPPPVSVKVNLPRAPGQAERPGVIEAGASRTVTSVRPRGSLHQPTPSFTAAAAAVPAFQPRKPQADVTDKIAATSGLSGGASVLASAANALEFRPSSSASSRLTAPAQARNNVSGEDRHSTLTSPQQGSGPSYEHEASTYEDGGAVYYNGYAYGPPMGYPIDTGAPPMYSPTYGAPFGVLQGEHHPETPPSAGLDGGSVYGTRIDGYMSAYPPATGSYYHHQPVMMQPTLSSDQGGTPPYEYGSMPPFMGYGMAPPAEVHYSGHYTPPPAELSSLPQHAGYAYVHAPQQPSYPHVHHHAPATFGSYPMQASASSDFNPYADRPARVDKQP